MLTVNRWCDISIRHDILKHSYDARFILSKHTVCTHTHMHTHAHTHTHTCNIQNLSQFQENNELDKSSHPII